MVLAAGISLWSQNSKARKDMESYRQVKEAARTDARAVSLGLEILKSCRNELYRSYPFLDTAFAALRFKEAERTGTMACDGRFFYFCPDFVMELYEKEPDRLREGLLHMLLHCLFLHIFPGKGVKRRVWDLACDMAAEQIIRQEAARKNRKERLEEQEDRQADLREQCLKILGEGRSVWQICGLLERESFPFSLERMEKAFSFDDHAIWYARNGQKNEEALRRTWEMIKSRAGGPGAGFGGGAGSSPGDGQDKPADMVPGRYDYRRFLKQFTRRREEMELDADSFDYIYYSLGMERYGNLPLIEPLEYREVNRLEELVIAIDTSGSCSVETVSRFLGETWKILSEKENFFRKMNVLLIQCDCCVQDAVYIHSRKEWEAYSRSVMIRGRAGTDFTPVFRYVQEQRKQGNLGKPGALIYFTDGDGIYPSEKPDYETAFVFVRKTKGMDRVPSWALRLLAEWE